MFAQTHKIASLCVQADGVMSNFRFDAYEDALPAWRFIDLTQHVRYTAQLLERTIRVEMHGQATFMRALFQARIG